MRHGRHGITARKSARTRASVGFAVKPRLSQPVGAHRIGVEFSSDASAVCPLTGSGAGHYETDAGDETFRLQMPS